MNRLRFSLGYLAAVAAVLAIDMGIVRSLTRVVPGSNQLQYLIPIDATHAMSFLTPALGVLPLASVLVLMTVSQLLTLRRGGVVSASRAGFVGCGWLVLCLYMTIAALAPSAVNAYVVSVGERIAPVLMPLLGPAPSDGSVAAVEGMLCVAGLGLPQLLIALGGHGGSGGRGLVLDWGE